MIDGKAVTISRYANTVDSCHRNVLDAPTGSLTQAIKKRLVAETNKATMECRRILEMRDWEEFRRRNKSGCYGTPFFNMIGVDSRDGNELNKQNS